MGLHLNHEKLDVLQGVVACMWGLRDGALGIVSHIFA